MTTKHNRIIIAARRCFRTLVLVSMLFASITALQAQQQKQIKVADFSILDMGSIEERVFVIHKLIDQGYYCYPSASHPDAVDVYVAADADDELTDFDFFYDHVVYEIRNDFSLYDKETRGLLFVQWRQLLDDDLFAMLYDSFTRGVRADNATCETALPFCTDNGAYTFPAGTNSGSPCGSTTTASCSEPYACSGTPGQSLNCLSSAPNPAFYYMRIEEPGDLDIFMQSTPRVDIDFDCWGPFDDITTACQQLSCSNIVDCSYSAAATEHCYINNAQTGQYYILLITNYSNDPCNINFENQGGGTTDCGILPPLVANDGPYCEGQTIHLTANGQPGATYSWSGPNHFSSTEQSPTIPNCTPGMAGDYVCTITLDGQSNNATTIVEIFQQATPSFTSNTVCQGEATLFEATTSGSGIVYEWDFGDEQNGNGQSVSHVYAQAGTYQVTLNVANEDGSCPGEITQTVVVDAMPDAGSDEMISISYGSSAQLSGSGGSGNFIYQWEPANMVTNPNSPNTQTIVLTQSQVYTLTITNPEHPECTDSKEVTVRIEGGALTASISAEPDVICLGENTQLNVTPFDGTGNYSFSWSHNPALTTATITVEPNQTTEYICTVNDGQTQWPVRTTVTVNMPEYLEPMVISEQCDTVPITWIDGMGNAIDTLFTQNTSYTFKGLSAEGCYREQTYHIEGMKYTPNPTSFIISGVDGEFVIHDNDTIAVVTETEFFSFNYDFTVSEGGASLWDECEWGISKSTWDVSHTMAPDRKSSTCNVVVHERENEAVELTCMLRNSCMEEGEYMTYKFFLKSSYIGIDESETAKVSIVPNPNNGRMHINFEGMEGRVNVKVFDMKGTPIDSFETHIAPNNTHYEYNMRPFAEGVYFFVITGNNSTVTRKVVIIH
ncbi:MAG: PKD domain-containing protein [Bacteroidales bacterium]|nr:PKD domain-containing protein [Bacteroidales bacterium]